MAMTLVSTVTLGSSGDIQFTNIPQDGVDLVCLVAAQTAQFQLVINSTLSVYSNLYLQGDSSGVATSSNGPTNLRWDLRGGALSSPNRGNAMIYIPNYTGSQAKCASADTVSPYEAVNYFSYLWAGASTITSAVSTLLVRQLQAGSTASLYKITAD